MATAGRKPLGIGHVDQLSGSELAKLRLTTILQTLRGELKVADAGQVLGVCESRFFALRNEWLQESLELLEPRIMGRPPKPLTDPRQRKLEQTVAELKQQLHEAQVRRDVDRILVPAGAATMEPSAAVKKKMRANRRRRAR